MTGPVHAAPAHDLCARGCGRVADICDLCAPCEELEYAACLRAGVEQWTAEALALPLLAPDAILAMRRERARRLMVEGCETALRGSLAVDLPNVMPEKVTEGIAYMVEQIGRLAALLDEDELEQLARRSDDDIRQEAAQVTLAAIAPRRPS